MDDRAPGLAYGGRCPLTSRDGPPHVSPWSDREPHGAALPNAARERPEKVPGPLRPLAPRRGRRPRDRGLARDGVLRGRTRRCDRRPPHRRRPDRRPAGVRRGQRGAVLAQARAPGRGGRGGDRLGRDARKRLHGPRRGGDHRPVQRGAVRHRGPVGLRGRRRGHRRGRRRRPHRSGPVGGGRLRRRRHVRGVVRRAPSPAARGACRPAAAGTGRRGPPDRDRGADPHRARAARRGRPPGEPDDGAGGRGQGRGRRGPRGRPAGDGSGGGGGTPGAGRAAPPARGPPTRDRPRRTGPPARPRGSPPARRAAPPSGAHQRAQARRSRCPHRGAARHRQARDRHRGAGRRKGLGAACGGGQHIPTARIGGRRPAGSPVGVGSRHRGDAGAATTVGRDPRRPAAPGRRVPCRRPPAHGSEPA